MKLYSVSIRIVIYLTTLWLIVGCNTFQFTSEDLPILPPRIVTEIKRKPIVEPTVPTFKYGRFLVEVYPDKDIIYGGVFKPELPMPYDSEYGHVIFINYKTKELSYFRLNGNNYEPVLGYAVMTPLPESLPKDVVRGLVTRIDTKPTWCPTVNIRREYPNLPKGCLPFGHELNAMGVAKFELKWEVPNWEYVRLHGTGGYAEGNFWDQKTFGCTRLKNDLILELLSELDDLKKAVKEGIEVIAYR